MKIISKMDSIFIVEKKLSSLKLVGFNSRRENKKKIQPYELIANKHY